MLIWLGFDLIVLTNEILRDAFDVQICIRLRVELNLFANDPIIILIANRMRF